MATAGSRARKPKGKESEASELIAALKFVQAAQRSDGLPYQAHCRITAGNVLAFDGGIAACHKIDTDIEACPHTATLIKALERCQSTIAITLTDGGKLSIKSGKLKALVPCLPAEEMPPVMPDPACANINDNLKAAIAAAVVLCSDSAAEILTAGVYLKNGSAIATNRHVIMEYWHGIDLPPGIFLPKASVYALCKTDKPFKSFGFSNSTATFYYEDGSYIKTSLFDGGKYPSFEHLLNVVSNPWPLPDGLYEAMETVLPFADDGRILFSKDSISAIANKERVATFDIGGIPDKKSFNGLYFKILKPFIKTIDFGDKEHSAALFFGDNCRGAIAPCYYVSSNPAPATGFDDLDDDIPF